MERSGLEQGFAPDYFREASCQARRVPRYLLHHSHTAEECGVAYAAWRGFDSPLRRLPTLASCFADGHAMWWNVKATDGPHALALLPPFVATRTTAIEVSEVEIP